MQPSSKVGPAIRISLYVGEYALLMVTVQFERCFRLMEHISVISWCSPINLYITEKLFKLSKSLFYSYLVILNK